MKWLLVWTAIIAGNQVNVTDADHPDTFGTLRDCAEQVKLLAPQIDALMRKHPVPNFTKVIGQCMPIEDEQPKEDSHDEG